MWYSTPILISGSTATNKHSPAMSIEQGGKATRAHLEACDHGIEAYITNAR